MLFISLPPLGIVWALAKRMYLALYKLNWYNQCDSRFVEPFVQYCTATQTLMLLKSDSKLVWLKTVCMSCTECLFLVGGPMQGCTSKYRLVSAETCFRTKTLSSRQCAVGSLCSPHIPRRKLVTVYYLTLSRNMTPWPPYLHDCCCTRLLPSRFMFK
jgi:hypothetical protein